MSGTEDRQIRKYHRKISGLSCSFCVETVKKAVSRINGVEEVHVSLSHEEILVLFNPKILREESIESTLRKLGYKVREPAKRFSREKELKRIKNNLLASGALALIASTLMILMWIGIRHPLIPWIMLGTALTTMFGAGLHIKKMAWHSLRSRILNQHVLLEMGAFSGLIGGILGLTTLTNFPAADFLAISTYLTGYHILGEWSSLYVKNKASQAVDRLLSLQPRDATIIIDDKEVIKPIEEINIGDTVRVRPGERIPIDGVITRGETTVDESILTGESLPNVKKVGDEVIGGSINLTGSIDIKVTKVGEDTFIQRVAKMVEEARALKPSILLIIDKVLKYYVPTILTIGIASFIYWSLITLLITGAPNISRALYAALSVYVMGYPCALGMSMPLAIMRGGGEAAEKGILMRSGEAFQTLPSIKKIIFDKTGTLTKGEIHVIDILCYRDRMETLKLIGSAELLSDHPLARAIKKHLDEEGITYTLPNKFKEHPGKGVEAIIKDRKIYVGRPSYLEEMNINLDKLRRDMAEAEERGWGVAAAAVDGEAAALIIYADPVKEGAKETIMRLREMGIEPIMITGDREKAAAYVASQLGIKEYYAEVYPEDKMKIIKNIQSKGIRVAMVGDGVNDAPSLMEADAGIAIGTGTDIAIESADIIIMSGDPRKVLDAIEIARRSYRKTKENLLLAFLFNGIGVPAAATGLLHPSIAMVAMALSITTILLNSFIIKKIWRRRE